MDRCKVILKGRVGSEPEVFETKNGKGANFSFATSERWVKDGERKERTTWHRITVYSPGLVKMIGNGTLKKGQFVEIVGTLTYDQFEKEGVKQERAKILVNSREHGIDFLDMKPRDENMAGGRNTPREEGFQADLDDEIPF